MMFLGGSVDAASGLAASARHGSDVDPSQLMWLYFPIPSSNIQVSGSSPVPYGRINEQDVRRAATRATHMEEGAGLLRSHSQNKRVCALSCHGVALVRCSPSSMTFSILFPSQPNAALLLRN